MKFFIIHNAQGKIIRTGSCPVTLFELQAQPGEFCIEGVADNNKQFISIDEGELKNYPPKPDAHHEFDYDNGQWQKPDDYSIRVEQEQQKQIITNRSREYPPLTDLADAIYWQHKGDNKLMDAYFAKCDVVKHKFPKEK